MIIIDGKNCILGRLASFAAKEALKGEDISIVNCERIIITGNKKNIEKKVLQRRKMGGSSQKGPKHHRDSEKIVKKTIAGMLPNHKQGRGATAYKKIKCCRGIPKELENEKTIKVFDKKNGKFFKVGDLE